MTLSHPFKEDHLVLPLSTPLLQAIDGVMSLALCLQAVSRATQHLRTSEVQATCDGCFPASLSPGSGTFRAVHPVFKGGCQTMRYASLGFPFHFL